ncbi:MAG: MoxR family ATPase, partial [Sulfurifustaceae bacterium]
ERLAREIVAFVARLRAMDLYKLPGVAETLDWTRALTALDRSDLDPEAVASTLGVVLKYQDDIAKMDPATAARLVEEARAEVARAS